jgi:hypothetical protein
MYVVLQKKTVFNNDIEAPLITIRPALSYRKPFKPIRAEKERSISRSINIQDYNL